MFKRGRCTYKINDRVEGNGRSKRLPVAPMIY